MEEMCETQTCAKTVNYIFFCIPNPNASTNSIFTNFSLILQNIFYSELYNNFKENEQNIFFFWLRL